MSPVEYAAVFVVMAAAAGLQGGLGFGMNLLAAPLVALIEPKLVPGPLLVAAVLLTVLIARRNRAHVDWTGLRWVMAGRLPGTLLGALVVASISARGVSIAVGLAVLLAAALSVSRLALSPKPLTLLGAGLVSGFSGTVSSIGGPPLAVVYAGQRGAVIRGTLSVIFVIGGLISAMALALVGRLGTQELGLALLLQPPVILGFLASRRLAAHLDAGRTKAAVLSVSVLGAIAVIVSELV
ncbi:MAG TPA: sulfite exporter TauE/SafE family protein [Acidimicrobiales bacterium]|nr:sulfite exporter TauE/SafE family protein [Acidimicrobiales bacterium]